jgi:hypothetical protein
MRRYSTSQIMIYILHSVFIMFLLILYPIHEESALNKIGWEIVVIISIK